MISDVHRSGDGLIKPVVCVTLALLLVLALGGWGAYQDWTYLRQSVLTAEINRLRSHAVRTATRIERQLSDPDRIRSLSEIPHVDWLREHWARYIPPPDSVHGAIVDPQGIIIAHSDPANEGKAICPDWNSLPDQDAGQDVFLTNCPSLTGGPWTLDIVVPIMQEKKLVATYHSGASQEWIEQQILIARRRSTLGWGVVIGGIIAVVLLSSFWLYRITRRSVLLEAALRQSHTRRLAELHYLIIGMAHEVRNPLNAVRLNLFTADRVFRGEASLDDEEVSTMIGECVREIERVDELMTLLLGYARVEDADVVEVDVVQEVRSVIQLLTPSFNARKIRLTLDLPESDGCITRAGRGEVRQVLLNLLNNAAEAVKDEQGAIDVFLVRSAEFVEVSVTDNGNGIPSENRHRLFSPFFTTKESGTGLGLALVRNLVERAGGSADCVSVERGHCRFRVRWLALTDEPIQTLVTI